MYCAPIALYQKRPRVHKIVCPRFWGRKWLRQFYGRLGFFCALSAGKPPCPQIPSFFGGRGLFWVFARGSASFICMGGGILLIYPIESSNRITIFMSCTPIVLYTPDLKRGRIASPCLVSRTGIAGQAALRKVALSPASDSYSHTKTSV